MPMLPDTSFCLFHSGGLALAVAVEHVEEVLETEAIVRISGCPPQIVGLCPHHRQVIPVVSLRSNSARSPARPSAGENERQAVMILRTVQGPLGIRIEGDAKALTTARPTRHEPRTLADVCVTVGSVRQGDVDYALVDPEATWQALRGLIVNWYANAAETASHPEPPLDPGPASPPPAPEEEP